MNQLWVEGGFGDSRALCLLSVCQRLTPLLRHLVPAARPRWSLCSLSDSPTLLDSLVHLNSLDTPVDCSLLPAPDTHSVVPIHHTKVDASAILRVAE